MIPSLIVFISIKLVLGQKECYWNAECPYFLYSTKTPYDTIRGDIRDFDTPQSKKCCLSYSNKNLELSYILISMSRCFELNVVKTRQDFSLTFSI